MTGPLNDAHGVRRLTGATLAHPDNDPRAEGPRADRLNVASTNNASPYGPPPAGGSAKDGMTKSRPPSPCPHESVTKPTKPRRQGCQGELLGLLGEQRRSMQGKRLWTRGARSAANGVAARNRNSAFSPPPPVLTRTRRPLATRARRPDRTGRWWSYRRSARTTLHCSHPDQHRVHPPRVGAQRRPTPWGNRPTPASSAGRSRQVPGHG